MKAVCGSCFDVQEVFKHTAEAKLCERCVKGATSRIVVHVINGKTFHEIQKLTTTRGAEPKRLRAVPR
jgi:hypothetical protein